MTSPDLQAQINSCNEGLKMIEHDLIKQEFEYFKLINPGVNAEIIGNEIVVNVGIQECQIPYPEPKWARSLDAAIGLAFMYKMKLLFDSDADGRVGAEAHDHEGACYGCYNKIGQAFDDHQQALCTAILDVAITMEKVKFAYAHYDYLAC